ncbi:sporulation protein YqfD [Ralstonia pickettii]|nr:sporulation protein YqfD [Ralstonia pickettii]
MKHNQGTYISGYVQISVNGKQPEAFLNRCVENGVMVWDASKPNPNLCLAKIHLKDIHKIRHLRKGTEYKVRFKNKYGLPFTKNKILKKKPLLIGLILSVLLFTAISNMIWQVTITGVPEELEKKISTRLTSYGVQPGAFKLSIDSPNQIQQLLLQDVPELLWVGVEQKGTTYQLQGVEKIIIKDEPEKSPANLIAKKNAVIKRMYVKTGQPKVKVNDYVKKGTLLVSGEIEKMQSQEDEEENQAYERVAADGEIWATTWYTANVTVPLEVTHQELTGDFTQSYKLQIGSFTLPLWPWRKDGYPNEFQEIDKTQLKLLKWDMPIHFLEEKKLEKAVIKKELTKEEAIQVGIEQTKKDLMRQLGKDARILSEKVLHETIEHGKVKLSLYITVEENIAFEQPLNQGD